jgi:hypothetical protein
MGIPDFRGVRESVPQGVILGGCASVDPRRVGWRRTLETMIGIAVLLVGIGLLWLCFAVGVYVFTRTGREGLRIQRMEDERRQRVPPDR